MKLFNVFFYELVPIDPGKRYLYFQVTGGRAFLEHLQDPKPYPGKVSSYFTLHVNFMGQRYHSSEVDCACEPAFNEGIFLFFIYFKQ